MKKKSHIQKLFDQINGGDDVDAAEEAQEIMEGLLEAIIDGQETIHQEHCVLFCCDTCMAMNKAICAARGGQ